MTEATVATLTKEVSDQRTKIAGIDKEINSGGSTLANLRENLRLRKLQFTISDIKQKKGELDVEGAVKARTHFNDEYGKLKDNEDTLQKDVSSFSLG